MTSPLHAVTFATNGTFSVVADACAARGIANAAIVMSSTSSFFIGLSLLRLDCASGPWRESRAAGNRGSRWSGRSRGNVLTASAVVQEGAPPMITGLCDWIERCAWSYRTHASKREHGYT